jgi:hypothetical protein
MKKMRFLIEDLEDRAGVLLESGNFIAMRRDRGKTCALYELFNVYVEVVVKRKQVQSIEFLYDTDRLAQYIRKQELKALLS